MKKIEISKQKEKIIEASIEHTITGDYSDYAVYVLKDRAIPNLYTGLKPIQNKLIYTMHNMGLRSNGPFRKCIPIKGQTAFLSIHGADAIYGALVNLAQWFNNYCPLIFPKGNFGHITGSGAAADRYCEAKLAKYAEEVLLKDLNKDTVDWVPNYDNTLIEPLWLPSKLPNLLINGALGLGVGFKTSWVTHNPVDVINVCTAYVKNRKIPIEELIKIIGAPDFPTGGVINGLETVRTAYMTGTGSVLVRGEYESHVDRLGNTIINITSIPYGVTTSSIIQKIAMIADQGKIQLKSGGLNDLTSEQVNIELILKKEEDPQRVMNIIYKETPLETRIPMIHNALVFNPDSTKKFVNVSLKDMISSFVTFRENTIYRKLCGELNDKRHRVHMIDGVLIISGDIEKTVKTVQASSGRNDAIEKLIKAFKKEKLDREQAEYIVDLKLYRLNKLDIGEMKAEKKTLEDRITTLIKWTATKSNKHIDKIMLDEWSELNDTLFKGFKRKSRITEYVGIKEADTIKDEPCLIVYNKDGYIKRVNTDKLAIDGWTTWLSTSTTKRVTFFSQRGKVYTLPAHKIPSDDRGVLLRNLLNVVFDEFITEIFAENTFNELVSITKYGMLKITRKDDILPIGKSGRVCHKPSGALSYDPVTVVLARMNKESDIMIASKDGKVVRTDISDIKPTSVGGVGVGVMDGDVISAHFLYKGNNVIRYQTDKKTGWQDISGIRKIKRNGNAIGVYLTGKKINLVKIGPSGEER